MSHLRLYTVTAMRTSLSLCNVLVWVVATGFLSIIHIRFVLQSINAVWWVLIMQGSLIIVTYWIMTFVFSRYDLAICLNNDSVIPSDSDAGKSYSRDE